MTTATASTRRFSEAPIVFQAYLPLKQHSEPEDGAIEEEGSLRDYVLSDDIDWTTEED